MGDDWNWDDAKGRAKEAFGAATGDKSLEREGEVDQGVGSVKDAAGDAADKAGDFADRAGDRLKDAVD